MNLMKAQKILLLIVSMILVSSCSEEHKKYIKSPLDIIVTNYIDMQNYSVVLADMDYKKDTDKYFHKYKIILEKPSSGSESKEDDFDVKTTEWIAVSPITFEEHQKDLGMTVLSKKDGVLDKTSTPAGYDNYVGNKKYGSWNTNSSGSSFWAFYGQYHFMSSLFYGSSHRYRRSDYDYYRGNHYGKSNYYGRNNDFGTSTYKSKNWSSKSTSFKDNVRSKVNRSSSALKSKGYSSSKSYGNSKTTTRNSSRYSNSSSSRSRSGGFGK
ncbi:MAG: hypothetical protein ACI86H_001597 [bacterium]|jgi:hypothetical protein